VLSTHGNWGVLYKIVPGVRTCATTSIDITDQKVTAAAGLARGGQDINLAGWGRCRRATWSGRRAGAEVIFNYNRRAGIGGCSTSASCAVSCLLVLIILFNYS
jgi:hypothetical protein